MFLTKNERRVLLLFGLLSGTVYFICPTNAFFMVLSLLSVGLVVLDILARENKEPILEKGSGGKKKKRR